MLLYTVHNQKTSYYMYSHKQQILLEEEDYCILCSYNKSSFPLATFTCYATDRVQNYRQNIEIEDINFYVGSWNCNTIYKWFWSNANPCGAVKLDTILIKKNNYSYIVD
jgi:hypothetical protein